MRYYFDIYNGDTCRDDDGLDFPTVHVAITEAARAVSAMSASIVDGGAIAIEVRDADGIVAVVTASIEIDRKR